MRSVLLFLALGLLHGEAASAKEYGLHGGKEGALRVRGVAEKAVKLTAGVAGWYLTLDVPGDNARCSAELKDVSPIPGHLPKWIESVPNVGTSTTITLDPERYLGTHTYRVSVRCGVRELSHGFVHLLPPVDEKTQQKFDMAQKASNEDTSSDPIPIIPKSAL